MICVNELSALKCSNREILSPLIILLSPFTPHFSEEMWSILGNTKSVEFEPFPLFDASHVTETVKDYPVSFNGKMRFTLKLSLSLSIDEIKQIVINEELTQNQLQGNSPKKVIVVPGKIINIVI